MASKALTALGGAVLAAAGVVYTVQAADLLEGIAGFLAIAFGCMLIVRSLYELLD